MKPIELILHVPKLVVAGQPVRFEIVARNSADSSVPFNVAYPDSVDFSVMTSAGKLAWHLIPGDYSAGMMGLNGSIPPHGERVLQAVWNQRMLDGEPAGTGHYKVTATLFADRPIFEVVLGPVNFEIVVSS